VFLRAPLGLDGSDQMPLIMFVAAAIYKLFLETSTELEEIRD
jgi:hypothetical protein